MCAGLSHELASRGTQAIGSSTADPLALKHSKRHVTLAVVVLYWVGTAMSYAYLEGWTMVDSLYAIFITYTTIGLGDFVPEPNLEYDQRCVKRCVCVRHGYVRHALNNSKDTTLSS